MPPPAKRRTGLTRRAQQQIFTSYVVGVIGALAGAVLLVLHLGDRNLFVALRSSIADATAPPAQLFAQSRVAVDHAQAVLNGYLVQGATIARLQREVALARVQSTRMDALADENNRLKAQLHLATGGAHTVANGWLIASTDTSTRRFATISAGARDGVRSDMPVVSPLGLIGRVLEVGQNSARVLLIADSQSVVPVRRARDGVPAFATGRPDGQLQLRLISLGLNPLRPGDAFVTSGSGGLYWPGTPIAVVVSPTRDGAIARVLADPADSQSVIVQSIWSPVADPTLPPPPAPEQQNRRHK